MSASFAVIILFCLSTVLFGCDDGNAPVAPTATVAALPLVSTATATPLPEQWNPNIDPKAVQILKEAATVSSNLKSYHYVYHSLSVQNLRKIEVDVVAPDRCRETYVWDEVRFIRIGEHSYMPVAGTDSSGIATNNYVVYNDQFHGTFGCRPDGLPASFQQIIPRLIEASIVGEEYLEGHKVVHIRYTTTPPSQPFPTGSGAMSMAQAEIWIEDQTWRVIKANESIHEPEFYQMYSRFDEPVIPPIERPTKLVTATPTPIPTAAPPPVPTSSLNFPTPVATWSQNIP